MAVDGRQVQPPLVNDAVVNAFDSDRQAPAGMGEAQCIFLFEACRPDLVANIEDIVGMGPVGLQIDAAAVIDRVPFFIKYKVSPAKTRL